MREQRKVVTILFADVVGSTALAEQRDPEVVRATMARYFQRIGEVVEAYGGIVEKFAGDAAMVVFGVPTVHDDDAERAVRAALEIRDGAAEVAVRVGVNTGEAVTAAREDRQFMVSGDAVNVAARLQQGAESGEVIVGSLTEQLTRNAIEYEVREPVAAKGKREPVAAFRAIKPRSQVPVQARGVPGLHADLVGRDRELRLLLDTFERTSHDRRLHLFTLVGAAGVGKSRLVTEALGKLAGSGARLLRGRCLPYGRGVTYWPFIEMVTQDTGIALADEREVALAKLDRWLGEVLSDDAQRPAIRSRLAVMMGVETSAAGLPDTPADRVDKEIAWGVRHYLEAVARLAPVIVLVDDLQWAEPPIIQLLEQLAERSADVPLLLICIARPEFLDAHRDWGSGKPNSSTITLDPLSQEQTGTLISRLLEIEALPTNLRAQIIERSAGTPLFCEEFIHMLIDDGMLVRDGSSWRATGEINRIRVPESIQAVLAARLDGLPDADKVVLQAASVIGERFLVEQVASLVGGTDPEADLESLRRKGLVTGGDGPGDEMRFRHLLVRDAAYASLPKSERVALHDRFGSVLEAEAGDPRQMTEILAHHAERALTLSIELSMEGDPQITRARRALEWALAMAERAMDRSDRPTVEAALQTARAAASALPDRGGLESGARLSLLDGRLLVIAADYPGATRAVAKAADLAEQAGLPQLVATARLSEAWIWNWSGEGSLEDFDAVVERAVDACHEIGDVSGEIDARHVGANHQWSVGNLSQFVEINELLVQQAQAIGDTARAASMELRLCNAEMQLGNPGRAEEHLTNVEAVATRTGLRNIALETLVPRGHLQIERGDLAAAERTYGLALAAAVDAGVVQQEIRALRWVAIVQMEQHRHKDAGQTLDRVLQLVEASGERWNRSELLGMRARTALALNDLELAERLIDLSFAAMRDDDVTALAEANSHLGLIRAAQARYDEAEVALRRSLEAV
ncbi:MAG TPA: adenylate/guanylate cyclase domain-containing protein, partial [Candidatus Dormibacteraeota bacterium]|nr:adenylate/guanylate cyclase domain-containing protein [Candidatus Dormibacteraeota bacterium]